MPNHVAGHKPSVQRLGIYSLTCVVPKIVGPALSTGYENVSSIINVVLVEAVPSVVQLAGYNQRRYWTVTQFEDELLEIGAQRVRQWLVVMRVVGQ